MLESLKLENVGPVPKMEIELAPRMNLLTGDNGTWKELPAGCSMVGINRALATRSQHTHDLWFSSPAMQPG